MRASLHIHTHTEYTKSPCFEMLSKKMASQKLVYACHLTSLLLLFTTITYNLGPVAADEKVTLSLYYESLCPFCANFIVNQLGRVFQSGLISIVNLRLIPWGNTQFSANNTWVCQHGVDECVLNIVEACAVNLLPDMGLQYKFIQCIELLELQGRHNQWQSCIGSLKINPKPVTDCYQTRVGVDLELRYADETGHLNPPHRFVPWVVVNNNPLQEDYQNFVAYVCKAYRGPNTPQACQPHLLGIKSPEMAHSNKHNACYPGTSKDLALYVPEEKAARSAATTEDQDSYVQLIKPSITCIKC